MDPAAAVSRPVAIAIEGMSCSHCVGAVKDALAGVQGVRVLSVSVGAALVDAAASVCRETLVGAIDEAGFTARIVDGTASKGKECGCGGRPGSCQNP